jgi:hypothetical protein
VLARLARLALLVPVLTVETVCAYAGLARRNSERLPARLLLMPRDAGGVELLPVCSCCRMRAMRPRGTGRICPDCDLPLPVDTPERRPPPGDTNGGVSSGE